MVFKSNRFNVFISSINENRAKEKAEETRAHISRLNDMQIYVDLSEEKLDLLLKTIRETTDDDSGKTLLQKGVIVYIKYLEVVERIRSLLEDENGIKTLVITSATSQKQREAISNEFMKCPNNTVVLFSSAGSESLDLNSTNSLVLYDTPDGARAFSQTIGRICRGFGEFSAFNIHEIVVEETLDEYKRILLSSKRELEHTILNSDTIPLRHNIGSFDADVLKKVKAVMLWKLGKKKRKPKI